jgi:hypothetical protein
MEERKGLPKDRKPAWIDKNVAGMPVTINEESRLRKLMKTEAETKIAGDEYTKRLQEYHSQVNQSSLFQWAKAKPEATQQLEEEDPISKLLHSNTSIFEKSDAVLQQGTLQYMKLKPANAISMHQ